MFSMLERKSQWKTLVVFSPVRPMFMEWSLIKFEKGKRIYSLREISLCIANFLALYRKQKCIEWGDRRGETMCLCGRKIKSWASICQVDEVQNQHCGLALDVAILSYIMHSLPLFVCLALPLSFFISANIQVWHESFFSIPPQLPLMRDFNFFFVVHSCTILTQLVYFSYEILYYFVPLRSFFFAMLLSAIYFLPF